LYDREGQLPNTIRCCVHYVESCGQQIAESSASCGLGLWRVWSGTRLCHRMDAKRGPLQRFYVFCEFVFFVLILCNHHFNTL